MNETENENVEEVMENSTQSVDSMRTPETIVINNELEIVELTGNLKFKNSVGYTMPEGYCFMHPDKGVPGICRKYHAVYASWWKKCIA